MAASIFSPLTDDLIGLINTFAKTSAILESEKIPNSHEVHEAASLNLGAFLHQFWKHADPQPSISATDNVETLSQAMAEMSLDESGQPSNHHISKEQECSSDASRAVLGSITAEVQVLRDAFNEPVQAINALIAMYIIQSFDEPLLELLTPTQCAQLFEAIYLADVAAELDKQIRVLKVVADDHRRINDPHLQLVQEIKSGLIRKLSDMRAFAVQHATIRISSQHIMLASQPGKGDLLSLDEPIKKMYADIRDRGDLMQHLVWEQERTIIALKVFLEDKIEKFQQRHVERSQPPSDRPRYAKDWPSATIPLSQLATVLLSSMLAHLVESANLPASTSEPQDPTSSAEPVMETKGKAPAVPLSPLPEHYSEPNSPIEENATPATVIGPSDICQPSPSSSLPRSVSPEIFTSTSPAPHVKFYLPKLLNRRRDSAISLLSSTGHPEKLDIQDDETLPGSDSSECEEDQVMSEPEDTTEIEDASSRAIGTEEAIEGEKSLEQATVEDFAELQVPEIEEKGKGPAIIDSNVENEVAVTNHTNLYPDHNADEEDQVMSEPDDTTEVEDASSRAIGTEEAVEDEQSLEQATVEGSAEPQGPEIEEKGEGPAIIESNVENEVVAGSHTSPHPEHNPGEEDLYSADDVPTLRVLEPLPILEEHNLEGDADTHTGPTPPQASSNGDISTSYATPFLSTNWPQRAWLQTVLSMLTPVIEAHPASPVSPSFDPESLSSPPVDPPSSEWYSGYDAWWSFTMRGGSGQRDDDDVEIPRQIGQEDGVRV